MNKLLLTLALALATCLSTQAQAPKGINYQGVARDNEGKPIISMNISVRISILKGAVNGEVEYSETHKPQTNQFGLFTLVIGQGTAGTGSFAFVSWAVGNKWLQIEIDPSGGSSFQLAGSQQLMSVPYAFYSEYSGNSSGLTAGQGIAINNSVISNAGDGDANPVNELITSAILTADKKLRITDAGGTKEVDFNSIANTDNQSLSLTGTNLAITGGNSVNLASVITDGQNLSLGNSAGTNRTINITNGTSVTLDVADADNDPANELQDLSIIGNNLSITNKTGAAIINLAPYLDNTDNQNLTVGTSTGTNRTINISNGTGVTIDVADNDNNSTNEIQALTKAGAVVSLSNGGGAITLNDDNATNEIQALTKTGTTISLSNGGGSVVLNDDNATNEIQNLSQVLTVSPNAGGILIQNIGTPLSDADAVTKKYVDDADALLAARLATTYAFKTSFNYSNSSGGTINNQDMIFSTVAFDNFNVLMGNTFIATEAGTYVFMVDGAYNTPSAGGQLNLFYNSIKFPITIVLPFGATVPRYNATYMFQLTVGQTVKLVGDNIPPSASFNGQFFGYKL